jgi:molybdopterin-guanine dinucleotide biosynthesis protein A
MQPTFVSPNKHNITGCILAGGQSSRMGGVDKGLLILQGQTLVQRAIERLQMQVNSVMVNANRHAAQYALHGVPVFADTDHGFKGPLAGFLTGLQHCPTDWLVTVPCDSPFFPTDLVMKLAAAAEESQALMAMAQAQETTADGREEWRLQPVFCLMHRQLATSLHRHLQAGGFKITDWAKQQRMAVCRFPPDSAQLPAFANANTPEELQHLQSLA